MMINTTPQLRWQRQRCAQGRQRSMQEEEMRKDYNRLVGGYKMYLHTEKKTTVTPSDASRVQITPFPSLARQ